MLSHIWGPTDRQSGYSPLKTHLAASQTAPEREAGSFPSYTLEVDSGDGPALHPGDRSVDMMY